MIEHLKNSILLADKFKSKLTPEILGLDGMCLVKMRHLLNNVVNMPGAKYLEVGVYKGATFVAALYKNKYDRAIAIDNWSENGDYRKEFLLKCDRHIGKYNLIFDDCFNVKIDGKINIYFYDGNHTKESHAKALSHFYDSLDDEIIFLVDDYNWAQVRCGTNMAVMDWDILYDVWLGHCSYHHDPTPWGAGIYAAVLKKRI